MFSQPLEARGMNEEQTHTAAASLWQRKRKFLISVTDYCNRMPQEMRISPPPVSIKFNRIEDGHLATEEITVSGKRNFILALLDRESPEHKNSFLLYSIIKHLRAVLINPAALEEAARQARAAGNLRRYGEVEQKLLTIKSRWDELKEMLFTSTWTDVFLRRKSAYGNLLAREILDVLEAYFGRAQETGSQREETEKKNGRHVAEEALFELRRRLFRGRLWYNDPWWPRHD